MVESLFKVTAGMFVVCVKDLLMLFLGPFNCGQSILQDQCRQGRLSAAAAVLVFSTSFIVVTPYW
jgi:hypothetical protein